MSRGSNSKIEMMNYVGLPIQCQQIVYSLKNNEDTFRTPDGHLDADIAINTIAIAAAGLIKNEKVEDKKKVYSDYSALLVRNVSPDKIPQLREYIKGNAGYMLSRQSSAAANTANPDLN